MARMYWVMEIVAQKLLVSIMEYLPYPHGVTNGKDC